MIPNTVDNRKPVKPSVQEIKPRSKSPRLRDPTARPPLAVLLVALIAVVLGMAFSLPNFLSRFTRQFTASTAMGISSSSAGEVAATSIPEGAEKATIAAGCFWGVEHIYRKHFSGKGLYDAKVGYIGGDKKNPSYNAVCGGRTGHAEAAQLIFDPKQLTYRQLLEFFYRMHDPTTPNQQGPDRGSQYRSAIFFHSPEQEQIAREVTKQVGEQWWNKAGRVVTEIIPAGEWWDAEKYHQLYLDKNPGGYECPSHYVRQFPDLH